MFIENTFSQSNCRLQFESRKTRKTRERHSATMFKTKLSEPSMNIQKMSYFSDIDLATLHRSRLNERIQYKLSWFNRRQKYNIPVAANREKHSRSNVNEKMRTGAKKAHGPPLNSLSGNATTLKTICVNKTSTIDLNRTLKCDNSTERSANKISEMSNNVQTASSPLADPDSIDSNRDTIKCLSGDAIERNAIVTNSAQCALSVDQAEEALTVPHRKRSGTWP